MRHMRLLAHALQVLGTLLHQGPVWFQDAWSEPEILQQVILLVCGLPDSLAIVCTLTCLIHGAVTAGLSYCPCTRQACKTLSHGQWTQLPGLVQTQRWVDDIVSDWDFTSVIPCHFAGPVPSSPQAVKTAFGFAFEGAERAAPAKAGGLLGFLGSLFRAAPVNAAPQLPLHDFRALLGIQNILKRTKVLNSTPLNQGRPE